ELPGRREAVGELQRLVDGLHPDPQLVLVDDERRGDEQDVPAAEDVHVALQELTAKGIRERAGGTVPLLEHLFGATVLHQLDAPEESAAAHVPDRWVLRRERAELPAEQLAEARRAADEVLALVGLERRDARGAGERVPALREAAPVDVILEVLRDLLVDD